MGAPRHKTGGVGEVEERLGGSRASRRTTRTAL